MANVFQKKRASNATGMINKPVPYFETLYMGRIETEAKQGGRESTRVIVQHLVDKTRDQPLKPVRIVITTRGLCVQEGPEFNPPRRETFVPIRRIRYGAADKKYTKVFSFVTHFQEFGGGLNRSSSNDDRLFYCYAFLCESQSAARSMVVYLLRAFRISYQEWKKKEIERLDVMKQEQKQTKSKEDDTSIIGSAASDQHTYDPVYDPAYDRAYDSSCSSDEESDERVNSKLDKLSHYLERWVHQQDRTIKSAGNRSIISAGNSSVDTSTDTEEGEMGYFVAKEQETEIIRSRTNRYSRPDILNMDVDLTKEMSDPDVQNVLEGMMKLNIPN